MKMAIASLKNLEANCFNQQLTPWQRRLCKLQYIVDPVALVPYVHPGEKKELVYELKESATRRCNIWDPLPALTWSTLSWTKLPLRNSSASKGGGRS